MKDELRYTLQHLGDIVAGALEKTIDTAKQCARGVALTYDIRDLQNKKRRLLAEIGERFTQVTKEGLTDVRRDDKLMELFSKLEAMEKTIQAYGSERHEMVTPVCVKKKVSEMKATENVS